MRAFVFSSFFIISTFLTGQASSQSTDSSVLTSNFTVGTRTVIPGSSLKPGSYLIRIVDHLSDRTILRIETPSGKVLSTFLGLPMRDATQGASGPIAWSAGEDRDKALRGYAFPGNYDVEFVYPKAQAVKLALANSAKVEAIDPASDNLPTKEKKLSADDMQIVTLWTLTPTTVGGPGETPSIAAAKYQAPAPPTPTYVAKNEAPTELNAAVSHQSSSRSPQKAVAPVRKPVLAALPHTASDLPAILFAGALAMLLALFIRLRNFAKG